MNQRKPSDATRPTHRPLIGTEARFIRLQPNSRADAIRCDLVYLPPTDVSCYVALSYVWGDPTVTQEIYLNDKSFQVTINLFAALEQLRVFLVDPSNAPEVFQNEDILFWVDALCIDQSDLEERAAQVPRMSQIYGSADLVIAWLGETGIHDDMIGMIMAIAKDIDENMSSDDFTFLHVDPLPKNELDSFINAFEDLLTRRWFRRVWVVQEVVLAPKDPVYLAGSYWCAISRLWFVWGCIFFSEKYSHIRPAINTGVQLGTYIVIRKSIHKLWTKREESIAQKSEKGLMPYIRDLSLTTEDGHFTNSSTGLETMTLRDGRLKLFKFMEAETIGLFLSKVMKNISWSLEATVPHDHIYGLLSLTKAAEIPKELKPDYTIPFPNVFHTYAKVILQSEQDLCILPRRKNGLSGVPSWVPDFRFLGTDFALRATIDSVVQIVNHGNVCITEGVHLGKVVLASLYKPGKNIGETQEVRECLQNLETFLQDVCKTQRLERKEILETCFGNWFGVSTPVPVGKIWQFYDRVISGLQLPSSSSRERYDRVIAEVFLSQTVDHSLIWTSSGILVRLTRNDESAKEGDILSIMKGTTDPFLLRPTSIEGEYIFIGNCRVFFGASKVGITEEFFAASKVQEFRLV